MSSIRIGMKTYLIRTGILVTIVAIVAIVYVLTPKANSNKLIQEQSNAWVINQNAGLYGRINLKDLELDSKQHIQEGNVFRNASVVENVNNASMTAGGKIYDVLSHSPEDITAQTASSASNLPGNASNISQNGEYVLMLSSDGVAYVSKANNVQEARKVNHDESKIVAASVTLDGVVIGYTDARTIVKYDYTSSKYQELEHNFGPEQADYSLDRFEVSLFSDKPALLYSSAKETSAKIYFEGDAIDVDSNPHIAYPSSNKSLFISSDNRLYKYDKTLQPVVELNNPGTSTRPFPDNVCNQEYAYTLWQSGSGIASVDCNNLEHLLTDSMPSSNQTADRGLAVTLTPEGATINALKTGEVWVANKDSFKVVPSTLNNWETQLDKQLDDTQKEDTKENGLFAKLSG